MTLLLKVLEKLEGSPQPEEEILQGLLDLLLGRLPVTVDAPLRATADGFGIVALRWHFRHAVEAAWAAFGRLIHRYRPPGCSARHYAPLVLRSGGAGDPWRPAPDTPLAHAITALGDAPGLELDAHWRLAIAHIEDDPAGAVLEAAMQLAGLARRVRAIDRDRIAFARFLDLQEPWWCPLSALAREIDSADTVSDWVAFVLDRYVIGQHFITAARKLGDDVDGYFFHPTDQGFRLAERVAAERDLKARWRPDAGPTKIPAALSLLAGAGLVDQKGPEWRVTSLGKATADRVISGAE